MKELIGYWDKLTFNAPQRAVLFMGGLSCWMMIFLAFLDDELYFDLGAVFMVFFATLLFGLSFKKLENALLSKAATALFSVVSAGIFFFIALILLDQL